MAQFGFSALGAIVVVVLVISFQHASALRCWECDSRQHPGCEDPFKRDIVSPALFMQCPFTRSGEQRVCVKGKSESTDYIYRKCSNYTIKFGEMFATTKCEIKTYGGIGNSQLLKVDTADICEICNDRDGCNGASKYESIAIMIAIPMAIMTFFRF